MPSARYDTAMRMPCTLLALIPLTLGLAACGQPDNAQGAGGVTVGEARALDDAAEMIEQRRLPASALHSPAPLPPVAATATSAP
jgi:hypothetical protein